MSDYNGYSIGKAQCRAYLDKCCSSEHTSLQAFQQYIRQMGFSERESQGLGYDPEEGKIIYQFPGSDYYFTSYSLKSPEEGISETPYLYPPNFRVGEQPLHNPAALDGEFFFIVENPLDAHAIHVCGYQAIATGYYRVMEPNLKEIKKRGSNGIAIVLTGDQQTIAEQLKSVGIPAYVQPMESYNDVLGYFSSDRESLKAFLTRTISETLKKYAQDKEDGYSAELERLNVKNPRVVASFVATGGEYEIPIPTGIQPLDDALSGGLRTGLYVLGAVSSLGKTTLAVQIADAIAASGRSVLFVTIEQSVSDIVAKSISRYVYTVTQGKEAISTISIRGNHEGWSEQRESVLYQACMKYQEEVGDNLKIMEGVNQPRIETIRAIMEKMQEHDGTAPVLFLDYLQLLAPQSDNDTDKRAVDKNVMALRQLSRDLKTPVFVISSLNRSSYSTGVTYESFKESGSIEYGSDVLLGLQPKGIGETLDDVPEKKQKRMADKAMREHKGAMERECELVILKNRNGLTPSYGIPLLFKPVSSVFLESIPPSSQNRSVKRI